VHASCQPIAQVRRMYDKPLHRDVPRVHLVRSPDVPGSLSPCVTQPQNLTLTSTSRQRFKLRVPIRDMRLVDPNLLTSETGKILVRDNAIVYSVEHVRIIITGDQVCHVVLRRLTSWLTPYMLMPLGEVEPDGQFSGTALQTTLCHCICMLHSAQSWPHDYICGCSSAVVDLRGTSADSERHKGGVLMTCGRMRR